VIKKLFLPVICSILLSLIGMSSAAPDQLVNIGQNNPANATSSSNNSIAKAIAGIGIAATALVTGTILSKSHPSSGTATASPTTTPYYVAVGADETILSSPDGSTWTAAFQPLNPTVTAIYYGIAYSSSQNLWVVVGNNGTIITSSDRITWTAQTSGVVARLHSVAYNSNLDQWVVVANTGKIETSSDGISWEEQTSGTIQNLYGVAASA